ncbi:hypothetical protein LTR73_008670 [Friedmanniomyces endolithicus]|nr:hypothetical protein LTR73_008670 [Friedmanniomyces endolithicus]
MTEIGSGGETTSERDGSSDAVVSPTSFSSSASEQIPYSLYLLSKIGSGNRLAASEEEETEEEEVRLLSQPEPFTSVSDIELLRVYLREPGIWVEALDSARHFTIVDMQHMMNCLPFKSAALALASTIKDMTDASCPAYKSLELYQKAITDLIRCRPMDDDGGVLAAAVLLFVYEMMAAKDVNWRRHLQGCADIWAAFCRNSVTLVHPDKWFDDNKDNLLRHDQSLDEHSHTLLWLFAQVVNFLADRHFLDNHSRHVKWGHLKDRLTLWATLGSGLMRPVVDVVRCESEVDAGIPSCEVALPTIIYTSNSSVISWYQYHTAMVLLLEVYDHETPATAPTDDTSSSDRSTTVRAAELYRHARRSCGIIRSNPSTPCLVNAIQPIWICGRNLRTATEKFTALEMLSMIQRETG